MEKPDLYNRVFANPYKISLAKQMEENRRLLEHYQRVKDQQKRAERLVKEAADNFVCDWQQS